MRKIVACFAVFLTAIVVVLPARAQCAPDDAVFGFSVVIGDLNGDGIAEIALSDPYGTLPDGGQVVILDGATGAVLCILSAPPDVGLFGLAVVNVCDFDGDGHGEVAIASILDPESETPTGIIHLYSAMSCKEVGYIKNVSQSVVTLSDVQVVGDLNDDKIVDEIDLLMLLAGLSGEQVAADYYALDVNKDGIVDFADVIELLNLQNSQSSSACEQAIVAMINAAEALLDDPGYHGNQTQSAEPIPMGLIGCAWCAIKCASALRKASDCAKDYKAKEEACWDDNLGDCFAISACLDDLRQNFLPTCLANVASAAGNCGTCVTKCGPKPR